MRSPSKGQQGEGGDKRVFPSQRRVKWFTFLIIENLNCGVSKKEQKLQRVKKRQKGTTERTTLTSCSCSLWSPAISFVSCCLISPSSGVQVEVCCGPLPRRIAPPYEAKRRLTDAFNMEQQPIISSHNDHRHNLSLESFSAEEYVCCGFCGVTSELFYIQLCSLDIRFLIVILLVRYKSLYELNIYY